MLDIEEFFNRLAKINPDPKCELYFLDPYTLAVGAILSAQATDKKVNEVTKKLFAIAHSPAQMIDLGYDKLVHIVKSIGLFRNKAKNIIEMSRQVIDKHDSKMPSNLDDLVKLPGIGRKTANVILNVVFNQPAIAVDTHVFRVSNRMGMVKSKNLLAIENELMRIIPEKFLLHAGQWLVLHGRYTCIAKKPRCSECIAQDICPKLY